MSAVAERVMECDAAVFQRDLNVLPYEVRHTLKDHPLFQLPTLAELAQRVAARRNPHMSGGDVYFNQGTIEAGTKPHYLGSAPDRTEEERARATELVKKIESAEAWIPHRPGVLVDLYAGAYREAQAEARRWRVPVEATDQKRRIAELVAAR